MFYYIFILTWIGIFADAVRKHKDQPTKKDIETSMIGWLKSASIRNHAVPVQNAVDEIEGQP